MNSISVAPDLSRRRKHFLNKKRERERDETVSCYFLYFRRLPLIKELYLVSYSDRMTEEAESKKLKERFPCKTEMNDNLTRVKKK